MSAVQAKAPRKRTMSGKQENFLTINDMMMLLKLSRPTITREIETGALRAAKIGNQYRVKVKDFDAWWEMKCKQVVKIP